MSKSVWVIERGEYSDYCVVGVFSTKENAQKVLDTLPQGEYDHVGMAEWPLDPFIDNLRAGLKPFTIWMLQNGDVEKVEEYATDEEENPLQAHPFRQYLNCYDKIVTCKASIYGTIFAKDSQHAIKIANEFRTRILAEGRWPAQEISADIKPHHLPQKP